jgi:hypothetical protein
LPDGSPDLKAPPPKTADGKPDLSGLWRVASGRFLRNFGQDAGVSFTPWGAAVYKERQDSLGKDRPTGRCLPHGVPDASLVGGYPFKILQLPGLTVILHEEMNHFRQIFSDGRTAPPDPQPTWFGYSIGRWEGETFVVETSGFNGQTWLDDSGYPATEAMRITERFRRRDFGRLEAQITIDDPKAYTKPWTVTVPYNFMADTEMIENICENEKDLPHMVGR